MTNWNRKSTLGSGLRMARREGDTIIINGGELKIEVVQIQGKVVRLAFEASRDIKITRGEQHEANSINAGEGGTRR